MDKQCRRQQRIRHAVQALWTVVTNSYWIGFVRGRIYQGKIKNVCVPGLNCYSCPGAVASCPIGALQATIGSYEYQMAFYVAGFMILVGTLMGRFVCGWLCPFGLVQDLLHKIPLPKRLKLRTFRGDRALRCLKYLILVVFVILMPLYFTDLIGQGFPWFCKLVCPVGTLEGGIPLVLLNQAHAHGHWVALCLEKCGAGGDCSAGDSDLPAVLQVSVPPGRRLLGVQSHLGCALSGGF